MGLVTHKSSPPSYSHSIGLVEYVVGRIRPLAGTLTWQNSLQFNFQATVLGLGCSDMRHGTWIIHAKEFTGKLCRFGEPAFGFSRVEGKGIAKWRRMLFIGKTEPHDLRILFDGSGLILTRSVRRIDISWKPHLKYFMTFAHWSWACEPGYGGRVLPTKSS